MAETERTYLEGSGMSKVTAVLIDVTGIQKYVFAGNQLSINVGASHIVKGIYDEGLQKAVESVLGQAVDLNEWRNIPDRFNMAGEGQTSFEVGYIGGGNALLFFRDSAKAKSFIKTWTLKLLTETPGLQVTFALDSFDTENFDAELTKLFYQLEQNKNQYFAQTSLPKYGITADCPLIGLSAECYDDQEDRFISIEAWTKLHEASENDGLPEELAQRFGFTNNINELGQSMGDNNHIAIVHIDGNGMGKRFRECKDLAGLRNLSLKVDTLMRKNFDDLLFYLAGQIDQLQKNGFKFIPGKNGKIVLPLRPVLIAGDDITFVAEGRLGVHLAEKYLCLLEQDSKVKISACAGVAITKTKYPFFRGYTLAEELCQHAKLAASKNEGTSWLDFHLLYGGISDPLEQIRARRYRTGDGVILNFGPYFVTGADDEKNSIQHLKKGIAHFLDETKWPRSKVKDFRTALTLGRDATTLFLSEMKARGRTPYQIPGYDYGTDGIIGDTTPYFDMIELIEYYPKIFLHGQEGNDEHR
jgi:hypothetical protein